MQNAAAWLSWVPRIAAGDREAEAKLVEHFVDGIVAITRRHCRPGDPAVDDIVQDVICHLLERLRQGALNDARALPAYIRTAVIHACTSEYRRRRLRGEAVPYTDTLLQAPDSDDPAVALPARYLALAIRQLVSEMPVRRDREVLVRFYLEEAGKERVCEELGIDSGHFHRVIHRARERFRALLTRAGILPEGGTIAAFVSPEDVEARSGGRKRSA